MAYPDKRRYKVMQGVSSRGRLRNVTTQLRNCEITRRLSNFNEGAVTLTNTNPEEAHVQSR